MKKTAIFLIFMGIAFPFLNTHAHGASHSPLSSYERKIIAAVLILEAASEGVEGMQAVLNVIYNRAGKDLHKVVGVTVKKGQFSSINSVTGKKRPDYGPILAKAYKQRNYPQALELVRLMEKGQLPDNTFGANHYHVANGNPPFWARHLHFLTTVGKHHFYTDQDPQLQVRFP